MTNIEKIEHFRAAIREHVELKSDCLNRGDQEQADWHSKVLTKLEEGLMKLLKED